MTTMMSWEALGTLAGAATLTYFIVAYTRRVVDRVWPQALGTDLYAVLVACGLLLGADAALGFSLTWPSALLAVLNAFPVAAVAGKMADKSVQERQRRCRTDAGR